MLSSQKVIIFFVGKVNNFIIDLIKKINLIFTLCYGIFTRVACSSV